MVDRERNRFRKSSVISVTFFILLVLLVVLYFVLKQDELDQQYADKQAELALVNGKIAAAQEKTTELQNEIEYRSTDEYIEEEARGLGLIDPNDIIIRPEE